MFPRFINKVMGLHETGLSPNDLARWDERKIILDEYWAWFTGEALKRQDMDKPQDSKGERPLKYPLRLNPLSIACKVHAQALMGDMPKTDGQVIRTSFRPEEGESDEDCKRLDRLVAKIATENQVQAMLVDTFMTSQPLGGVVFKVGYDDTNPFRPTGVVLEYHDPRTVFCQWSGTDYWTLKKIWIRYKISPSTAAKYGIKDATVPVEYMEYWDEYEWWITVDGKLAKKDGHEMRYEHDYGVVPFVYIPRLRANCFWGESLAADVIGLIEELNARKADLGDAVQADTHRKPVGKNIKSGYPKVAHMSDGTEYVDLGRSLNAYDQPAMEFPSTSNISTGSTSFVESIDTSIELALMTPGVTYGKDEGSQRSGATLAQRNWMFVSNIELQRVNWSVGWSMVVRLILVVLAKRKPNLVSKTDLQMAMVQIWHPIMPIDRKQLVDEIIRRAQENAASLRHMLESFGDVENIAEEEKRIWEDQERRLKLEAKSKPQIPGAGNPAPQPKPKEKTPNDNAS